MRTHQATSTLTNRERAALAKRIERYLLPLTRDTLHVCADHVNQLITVEHSEREGDLVRKTIALVAILGADRALGGADR